MSDEHRFGQTNLVAKPLSFALAKRSGRMEDNVLLILHDDDDPLQGPRAFFSMEPEEAREMSRRLLNLAAEAEGGAS